MFQVSIMPDSIPLRDATAEALRALLEKEKETFQRSCFCHVIMQRPCETEKMVGLEFCALGPETFMACRIYVDDQQIVRCLAEKPQDQAASFQLRSFVDSFGRARPGWEATILSRLG